MTCPHCDAFGVVEGIAEEVVPKAIQCGHCRQQFPYRPTAWDYIREDYDGEQAVFFLRVTNRPDPPEEDSEEVRRQITLKNVHTRVLLDVYRQARIGDEVPPEARIFWAGSRGLDYSGAEVKAELATREHIPNKKEAKERRQNQALKGRRWDL